MTRLVRTSYYHVLVCLALLFSASMLIGCASNNSDAMPQLEPPDPIEIEALAIPSQGAMQLIWMNPAIANITSFNISWVGPTNGSAQKSDQTMPGERAVYDITGLTDESNYTFLVFARIGDGAESTLILNLTARTGVNADGDSLPDSLDDDDDNDTKDDGDDDCPRGGQVNWVSNASADYDGDGCRDGFAEETDDDNDGRPNDAPDDCPQGELNWDSTDTALDFDQDGCRDRDEDTPIFTEDSYEFEFLSGQFEQPGEIGMVATRHPVTDFVRINGTEDIEIVITTATTAVLSARTDLAAGDYVVWLRAENAVGQTEVMVLVRVATQLTSDATVFEMAIPSQGGMQLIWEYRDLMNVTSFNISWVGPTNGSAQKSDQTMPGERAVHDITGLTDESNYTFLVFARIGDGAESTLIVNLTASTGVNADGDSLPDSLDDDDDNDAKDDGDDDCPRAGEVNWVSNTTSDHDGDGCRDGFAEEIDDDNDGKLNAAPDACPRGVLDWDSTDTALDFDQDGCRDMDEDAPIFIQNSYVFEFPPNRRGEINEIATRHPVTIFQRINGTENIEIGRTTDTTAVLSARAPLTVGDYVVWLRAENAINQTGIMVLIRVTDIPTDPPTLLRERTVIRPVPGEPYNGAPNLIFENSYTVTRHNELGLGNFSGFDTSIFGFDEFGNFNITEPLDPAKIQSLVLKITAENDRGDTEGFIHILVQDPANRSFYFSADGSVPVIGRIHPTLTSPDDAARRRFEIVEGNATLFEMNNANGDLSVTQAPSAGMHRLRVAERYGTGDALEEYFANVEVVGRKKIGNEKFHYVHWMAENAWIKPADAANLPEIDVRSGDNIRFVCPVARSAFPFPNVYSFTGRQSVDRCPVVLIQQDEPTSQGGCPRPGAMPSLAISQTSANLGSATSVGSGLPFYFGSFAGLTLRENSRADRVATTCEAGMKMQLNVLPPADSN